MPGPTATPTATPVASPVATPIAGRTAVPLWRRVLAEGLGTGALVNVVVGSGIAAGRLSTDPGLRLLEISLAVAVGLGVLIAVLVPVSGAHLNPVVSLVVAYRERRGGGELAGYLAAQAAGAAAGAVLANLMYGLPAVQLATTERASWPAALSEQLATAGLVAVVLAVGGRSRSFAATTVSAYVFAACWSTSSTAFANPAVTLGRVLTDTATGIDPRSALVFAAAQVTGAALGWALLTLVLPAAGGRLPKLRPGRPRPSQPVAARPPSLIRSGPAGFADSTVPTGTPSASNSWSGR